MNRKVCCDICNAELGMIDTEAIALPVKAEMFTTMDEAHELPPPFLSGQEWLDFRCWQCHNRPMHHPDMLTLINDDYSTELFHIKPSNEYICEKCGNEYMHRSSLARHRSNCNA